MKPDESRDSSDPSRRATPVCDSSLGTRSLQRALFTRGYEFDFFQAVRVLSRVLPNRTGVGTTSRPSDEIARFAAHLSLAFPASAIHDIEPPSDPSGPVRVTVAFMGLTGVQGVLPLHYTERMLARKSAKDETFRDFLDMFNHRFISHFYRAWEKHRPPVLYEMAVTRGQQIDTFTQYLFDFIGMGTRGLRGRMRGNDEALLLYAGLIAQRPHSASALRGLLRDYFALPVEIAQFIGGWHALECPDRSYLSGEEERNQLAVGAFIGSRVWDQQARFRVRLGPVGLDRFEEFLPGGAALARVMELTRFFANRAMAFDIQVALCASDVPYCRLSERGPHAPRLGWTAWLKTRPFKADAEDAVFTCLN